MIESFVDLTYRGLSLGRRIRLSQVRPSSGYLELPAPMPVGTRIAIATDDGVTIDATVTWIHEQVGGSDRPPGMIVAPALAPAPATVWWSARVALPDGDPAGAQAAQVDEAASAAPGQSAADVHEAPTVAMPAIELPAEAFPDRGASGEPAASPDPVALRSTGEHDVVDDGRRTMIMAPLDLARLGLDAQAGVAHAIGDAAGSDDDAEADAGEPAIVPEGSTVDPSRPPQTSQASQASQASGRGRKKRKFRR